MLKQFDYILDMKKISDLNNNFGKLKDFLSSKNKSLRMNISHDFIENEYCKNELENTYFTELAYKRQEVKMYWCHLTDNYVLEMSS